MKPKHRIWFGRPSEDSQISEDYEETIATVYYESYRPELLPERITALSVSSPTHGHSFDDEIATVQPRKPAKKQRKR